MSKHTPGPWEVFEGYDDDNPQYTIEAHGSTIAHIRESTRNPHPEDTACLIAAAPDLLEALQKLSIVMRELHDHWDNDRDMKVGKGLLALSGLLPGYDKRIDEIHAAIAKAEGQP